MVVGAVSEQGVHHGGRLPDPAEPPGGLVGGRRIRDDVRDGVYVMAFSCAASSGTALVLVLLVKLAGSAT